MKLEAFPRLLTEPSRGCSSPEAASRQARLAGEGLAPGGFECRRRAKSLRLRAAAGAAGAMGLLGLPGAPSAQEAPRAPESLNGQGVDTHLFRPAVDSKGLFSVNGTRIIGDGQISFGMILDYGRNLLRVRNGAEERSSGLDCDRDADCIGDSALLRDSFQGTFSFNYGIGNAVVVGLKLPVVLGNGDPLSGIGPEPTILYDTGSLTSQGLSWVALHAKWRITRIEETLGLGLLLQGGVPVGNRAHNLMSEPGPWVWPQLLADQQFGPEGVFRIGANVGYRYHGRSNSPSRTRFAEGQLEEGAFRDGNRVTGQVGVALRVLDSLELVAETYGTYLLDDYSARAQKFSQEYTGGLKLFVERNSYLTMGAGHRLQSTGFEAADLRLLLGFVFEPSIGDRDGDGYLDDRDGCPDDPEDFDGFEDEDGCPDPDNDGDGILDVNDSCPDIPEDFDGDEDLDGCPEGSDGDRDGDGILDSRDKCPDDPEDRDGFEDEDGCPDLDNDKDGILDVNDSCPNDPEDFDGFEDEDGCPEPDNDLDGILDVVDQCPNEPEVYNGFEDEDGCPDKGKVIVEGDEILLLEKIFFATDSTEILPQSFTVIDAVAATLKHHPEFVTMEVAGHADERASDAYNLRLTQGRAASVVQALANRHIDPLRLVSQGYGEFCPVDPTSNPEAWEKNRRVEFKIVKTEDGLTEVPRGCERASRRGVRPPVVEATPPREF